MRTSLLITVAVVLSFISCSQEEEMLTNFFQGRDRTSPVFLEVKTVETDEIVLYFNENVAKSDLTVLSDEKGGSATVFENQAIVHLSEDLQPMEAVALQLSVQDSAGNSTTIETVAYGKNFDVPDLILNEFTTKGSRTNPDRVEIRILSDGNMAGVTFYNGMYHHHEFSYIFESIDVSRGQYLVIQFQTEPEEDDPFTFYGGEEGLGSNNGVLSIYRSPQNEIVDAVVYSNRSDDSDVEYGGFGTKKVYDMVSELAESKLWIPANPITPETAVRSENSTATRSLNRKEDGHDSNTSADWYVVATRESTFGEPNSQVLYSP